MNDEINKRHLEASLVSVAPSNITQERRNIDLMDKQIPNHSTSDDSDVFSSLYNETTYRSNFITSKLRTTTSASLILLKPLSSKGTAKNNQIMTKTSARQSTKETFNPSLSNSSLKRIIETTMPSVLFTDFTESFFASSKPINMDRSDGSYIDEDTNYSPFENEENNPVYDDEALETKDSSSYTSVNPLDLISSLADSFPYKISNEIRRAPIKPKRKQIGAAYREFKGYPSKPTNKLDHEFNFPSFGDENIDYFTDIYTFHRIDFTDCLKHNFIEADIDYGESDFLMKKSADGSRTYVPEKEEPLTPSAFALYNKSTQNDAFESQKKQEDILEDNEKDDINDDTNKELLRMDSEDIDSITADIDNLPLVALSSTVSSEQEHLKIPAIVRHTINHNSSSTEAENMPNFELEDENFYDPATFYRTPSLKPLSPTEKVLTFCTKEIAIRDRHNLVIACGGETEIWQPFRCPEGSECFLSADSSYRICCAVAEAAHYAR
ncbi:unnamed protein product [Thelazia callipaeda]|uniref:Chitin-binding type-2 domain-containing protein n=1 Tax=Thelazia callipaeda TaxID=103827 RepID=A0A0N5D1U9_THECL|nr:unnamed protein product [Thelazia callipaeda]